MSAQQQPLLAVAGATTKWTYHGSGWLSKKNKGEWVELDKIMTVQAEAHFQATLQQFLYIPVTDNATLAYFFEANPCLFEHKFPVPQQAIELVQKNREKNYGEESEPIELTRLCVKLNILRVAFNQAAITGIMERLVASTWTPPSLFQNDNVPFDMVMTEFQRVVKTCCAAVRKPLSYLHRCIYPPPYLLSEKHITIDCGFFPKYSDWEALLLREIYSRLFRDGCLQIRFGPKPSDLFCSLPSVHGWDYGHPTYCNEALSWAGSCKRIDVSVTGMALRFGRDDNGEFNGISIECSDSDTLAAFMLHIWAAKVISYRTRLDEMACRQMLVTKL